MEKIPCGYVKVNKPSVPEDIFNISFTFIRWQKERHKTGARSASATTDAAAPAVTAAIDPSAAAASGPAPNGHARDDASRYFMCTLGIFKVYYVEYLCTVITGV